MKRTCKPNFNRLTGAMLIVLAAAGAVRADRITLRPEARVTGATVTLADVAKLEGPAAEALAETPLLEMTGERGSVTMQRVREALDEQGDVHWGKVNLRGAMKTTIHRTKRTAGANEARADDQRDRADRAITADLSSLLPDPVGALTASAKQPRGAAYALPANPMAEVASDGLTPVTERTVRDLVRERIESTYNRSVGEGLRINYRREDDPAWAISEADYRIDLDPATPDLLGRVPFTVALLREGRTVEEHRLTVDVALRVEGVVATRRLRRDQTITDRDVERETRWIERAAGGLVTDPGRPVGKTVTRLIPEGELISEADLAGAIVVRRGALIKARYLSGSLMLTVYCRAAEDGRLGDVIELRNTRNREMYQGRITGPNEAVLNAGDQAPEEEGAGS